MDKMADLRYIIIKLNREVKNVQVPYSFRSRHGLNGL